MAAAIELQALQQLRWDLISEAGMSKVSAISGATGSELEALTEKAKEMGAKTKFSATESAEAFQYMAMAGWKTGDMLDGIEGIMNLAAASGEDLATTSDIVTDALTAFGLSAKIPLISLIYWRKHHLIANTNVSMMGETFKARCSCSRLSWIFSRRLCYSNRFDGKLRNQGNTGRYSSSLHLHTNG